MNKKSIQSNTKTIIIPELEPMREAGRCVIGTGYRWEPDEVAILDRYYGYVKMDLLKKHLPGKSAQQIQAKASRLGLCNRWMK